MNAISNLKSSQIAKAVFLQTSSTLLKVGFGALVLWPWVLTLGVLVELALLAL